MTHTPEWLEAQRREFEAAHAKLFNLREENYQRDKRSGLYWVDRIEQDFSLWLAARSAKVTVTEEQLRGPAEALAEALKAQPTVGIGAVSSSDNSTLVITVFGQVLDCRKAARACITAAMEVSNG